MLLPVLAGAQQDIAAEREAYARLPVCRLGADGRSLEIEPCRTAPAQRPMPRRPVPRQDDDAHIGIPSTTPPASASRPVLPSATLEPRGPYPATPVPPVPPAVNPGAYPNLNPPPGKFATPTPTRPAPTTCVGGVCRDAAGTTFQEGGTGVSRSPAGRHCTSVGGFVRCM